VLAVASRLAQEEHLTPPVPITLRFKDAPGTGEDDWQERLIARLRPPEWIRLEIDEQLDYVGPVAQSLLGRYGVVHPSALAMVAVQLEHARGGSLLTGVGGDAICGGWLRPRWAELAAGRAWPRPSDVVLLGYAAAPLAARRAVLARQVSRPRWLTSPGYEAYRAARASELASRPVRWDGYLGWHAALRRVRAYAWTVAQLAADLDSLALHPFEDVGFVGALAALGGRRGLGDRAALMRLLFGDDLPADVVRRTTKANFTLAYFRGATRAFARRWDGRGLDEELVDPERLRDALLSPVVDPRAALALQAAWVDSVARGREQLLADRV
jgi:asparagine synthase (glutamine-hydrolysing)